MAIVEDRLIQIKSGLKIIQLQPNFDTVSLALLELAWLNTQYKLALKLLNRKEVDASVDYKHEIQYHLRCTSAYLSDYACIACHAANMELIDETQLWYIAETLSCAYAILSAWDDKLNSCVLAYRELLHLVEEYFEPHIVSDTQKKIQTIEFPYGHYRSVF